MPLGVDFILSIFIIKHTINNYIKEYKPLVLGVKIPLDLIHKTLILKMTNENKNEQKELMTFDLENENDVKELNDNVLNGSEYFKLNGLEYFKIQGGVTYKIELTSSKIGQIEKVFDGKTTIKYVLQIKSINSKKEEYSGDWEVGTGILKTLVSNYEKGTVFKVSRTGTGLDTRYTVLKDF